MAHKLGIFDAIVLMYLISHIPITMFIDGQAIVPKSWYPREIPEILAWYTQWSGDFLMAESGRPVWFRGIVSVELTLQMCYFFFAIYCWIAGDSRIRIPTIIYGAHTATTLVPILSTMWAEPLLSEVVPQASPSPSPTQPPSAISSFWGTSSTTPTPVPSPVEADLPARIGFTTDEQRWTLIAIYSPYLIMPLLMIWAAWARGDDMFPDVDGREESVASPAKTSGTGAGQAGYSTPGRSPSVIPANRVHQQSPAPSKAPAMPSPSSESTGSGAESAAPASPEPAVLQAQDEGDVPAPSSPVEAPAPAEVAQNGLSADSDAHTTDTPAAEPVPAPIARASDVPTDCPAKAVVQAEQLALSTVADQRPVLDKTASPARPLSSPPPALLAHELRSLAQAYGREALALGAMALTSAGGVEGEASDPIMSGRSGSSSSSSAMPYYYGEYQGGDSGHAMGLSLPSPPSPGMSQGPNSVGRGRSSGAKSRTGSTGAARALSPAAVLTGFPTKPTKQVSGAQILRYRSSTAASTARSGMASPGRR